MGPLLKGSLGTLAAMVVSELVYKLYIYWRQRRAENESNEIMEVCFFPDKDVACRTHFLGETRCFKDNCKYSHGKTSLSELYRHMNSCRKTIDVCVFAITSIDLVGIVLAVHRRGATARVITDDEQEKLAGSQIWTLRQAGITVRTGYYFALMHHKFVLVDGRLLINGSFNWTRKAIIGNEENVLITNHHKVVDAFKMQFEKLWEQFHPRMTSDTTRQGEER